MVKLNKINPNPEEELFKAEINDLAVKSYNEGAMAMAKSIRSAFRTVAMADTAIPRMFTARQVIIIIQDIMKGAKK